MINMEVRAQYVINLLRLDAHRLKILQIRALHATPARKERPLFIVSHTGINQDGVMLRAHHVGVDTHDKHAVRSNKMWCEPVLVRLDHLCLGLRQQLLWLQKRPFRLDDPRDQDITDCEILHTSPCCWIVAPSGGQKRKYSTR